MMYLSQQYCIHMDIGNSKNYLGIVSINTEANLGNVVQVLLTSCFEQGSHLLLKVCGGLVLRRQACCRRDALDVTFRGQPNRRSLAIRLHYRLPLGDLFRRLCVTCLTFLPVLDHLG